MRPKSGHRARLPQRVRASYCPGAAFTAKGERTFLPQNVRGVDRLTSNPRRSSLRERVKPQRSPEGVVPGRQGPSRPRPLLDSDLLRLHRVRTPNSTSSRSRASRAEPRAERGGNIGYRSLAHPIRPKARTELPNVRRASHIGFDPPTPAEHKIDGLLAQPALWLSLQGRALENDRGIALEDGASIGYEFVIGLNHTVRNLALTGPQIRELISDRIKHNMVPINRIAKAGELLGIVQQVAGNMGKLKIPSALRQELPEFPSEIEIGQPRRGCTAG